MKAKDRKGFVTLWAEPEFIGRLRTYCRDYKQGVRDAILFLVEEGMDRRRVVADPQLVEEEKKKETEETKQ